MFEDVFESEAGVGPDVVVGIEFFEAADEFDAGRGLVDGVAAAEGETAPAEFCFFDFGDEVARIEVVGAGSVRAKTPGFGVVATGAVEVAALGVEGVADASTIGDGFGDLGGEMKLHDLSIGAQAPRIQPKLAIARKMPRGRRGGVMALSGCRRRRGRWRGRHSRW